MTNAFELQMELSQVENSLRKIRAAICCSEPRLQSKSIYRARVDMLRTFIKQKYRIKKLLKYWI